MLKLEEGGGGEGGRGEGRKRESRRGRGEQNEDSRDSQGGDHGKMEAETQRLERRISKPKPTKD